VNAGEEYREAVNAASALADEYLVTFGIEPTHPHTGYGYIQPGERVGGGCRVASFVEKPDAERAREYIASGYLWNSGMFLFSTTLFREECSLHAPYVREILDGGGEAAYATIPSISIDHGLMERTGRAAVVRFASEWSDMGSFDSIYRAFSKDTAGNAVRGEYIPIESTGNLVIGERLVVTSSIHDAAIIDTRDVLFVGRRGESDQVKSIVEMLKAKGDDRAVMHLQVYRPWGSYTVLEQGRFYKIKRISVLPGRNLSFQFHHHRSEHWVVVQGTAEITIGDRTHLLRNGESTFVPCGGRHRLGNPGILPLEIIEVQIGEYIGEDDIVRLGDDFGRGKDD
jgi:mannose-1-phosphate guanylyltransferase/mannose-6-phosphate isomerase